MAYISVEHYHCGVCGKAINAGFASCHKIPYTSEDSAPLNGECQPSVKRCAVNGCGNKKLTTIDVVPRFCVCENHYGEYLRSGFERVSEFVAKKNAPKCSKCGRGFAAGEVVMWADNLYVCRECHEKPFLAPDEAKELLKAAEIIAKYAGRLK